MNWWNPRRWSFWRRRSWSPLLQIFQRTRYASYLYAAKQSVGRQKWPSVFGCRGILVLSILPCMHKCLCGWLSTFDRDKNVESSHQAGWMLVGDALILQATPFAWERIGLWDYVGDVHAHHVLSTPCKLLNMHSPRAVQLSMMCVAVHLNLGVLQLLWLC